MAACVLDPHGLLPGVEWETRERFLALGKAFCRQQDGRYALSVRDGRRTCARQQQIFQQGRTSSGSIVTHADGCNSWHVLGRAIDSDIVEAASGRAAGEALYRVAGELWKGLGGRWGGDFVGFPDIGHFEWHPGLSISEVCPLPAACSDKMVNTIGPGYLLWALTGVVVAGALAYAFSDELEKGLRRVTA